LARTALFVDVSYAVRRLFGRHFAGQGYSDGTVKSDEVSMPADDRSNPPVRLRLSHRIIVRAPGLLPMLYRPNELAEELDMSPLTIADWAKKGLPHQRDGRGHLWINGQELAGWVAQVRQSRASHPRPQLGPNESFCLRCRKVVEIVNPTTEVHGKRVLYRGLCPVCGGAVNRAGRHGASR
jgi:Domain of unknown function (DUF5679)